MLFPSSPSVRSIVSSILLISTTIANSTIGAIATTQPNWLMHQSATAQAVPQPKSTFVQRSSSAAKLGGVVFVNCAEVQFLPIPPQDCKNHISVGQSPIYDYTTLGEAEALVDLPVNAPITLGQAGELFYFSPRFRPVWQVGETETTFSIFVPVPATF